MGGLLEKLRGQNPDAEEPASGFTPYSWPTNSKATLCRVPWDATYRNVVDWRDQAGKDEYFETLAGDSVALDSMTYLKPNDPIFVDVPFSRAYAYNYVVVENPKLPVPGEEEPRKLYYFITAVGYVAPNTTSIAVQLDVWTTYGDTAKFGRCFVERGHVAIAAECSAEPLDCGEMGISHTVNYRRYLTAAEGLDVGSAYLVGDSEAFSIAPVEEDGGSAWRVIIMSTVDLIASWGSVSNPSLTTADGQITDGLIGGCNVYALSTSDFKKFMEAVSDAPWVAKGILSVTAFPSALLTAGIPVSAHGVTLYFLGDTPDKGFYKEFEDMPRRLSISIPYRYRNLHKFMTWPYSAIELNACSGSPVFLKPELLGTDTLRLKNMSCAVPGHIKIGFYPWDYGSRRPTSDSEGGISVQSYTMDSPVSVNVQGDFLDSAVWVSDMPKFSLVNDNYASYLASTAHTREWQYNQAGWQQSKSNASANLSYDQAQQKISTNASNYYNSLTGLQAMAMDSIWNAPALQIGDWQSGSLSGALSAMGADSNAFGWNSSDIANNVSGQTQFLNNQSLAGNIASQNLDLAQWAAKGDYENAIAGIDATVQDAAISTPSVIGQSGGNGFAMSNGLFLVQMRCKTIDENHQRVIGEYWLRYGYAVREFMTPPKDLCCMEHFTYWKMLETSIECAKADETSKETIRGIFEKGVTVWRNPRDITTLDIGDNDPVKGNYY
jgi:hypothetical protein